jgi:hypothetical protein
MALFSRKTPEQKAAATAARERRVSEYVARRDQRSSEKEATKAAEHTGLIESQLGEGERVLVWASCSLAGPYRGIATESKKGLVAATDRRLLWVGR